MTGFHIRQRLEAALAGEPVERPAYAVYDWFVKNRPQVDWDWLFELGLGCVNHANVIRCEHPGFELVETTSEHDGRPRRDVRIVTDAGELHEWYLGEWRQEYFIKTPEDYRIMSRALEGVRIETDNTAYRESEAALGDRGVTLGQIQGLESGRSPLMTLQVDWVGLERFSLDLAVEQPDMMALLEQLTELKLEQIRQAARSEAAHIKLWENLSIETLGPAHYRRRLVPFYREALDLLRSAGKRLHVHYDGQLRVIGDQIAALDIDGIDSFTEPPEGDMTAAEARAAWPDKFLWLHPNLGWYRLPAAELAGEVRRLCREAGPSRYCLLISEEVPPCWRESVPVVLDALREDPPP